MRASIATAATMLAASVFAQDAAPIFDVYTMQVFDMRIPYTQHNVSFNWNAPGSTKDQGGDDMALCSFGWTKASPDCWTTCEVQASNTSASNPATEYYAHLDYYGGADTLNITLWQSYPGGFNAGRVVIQNGKDGYYCSHGAQTTQCSIGFPFHPIPVSVNESGDDCDPVELSTC